MRQSSEKSRQLPEADRQMSDAGERVSAYLRRLYPSRTADQVAADTGIKTATVAKWLERESVPNGVAMLLLLTAYGPDFMGAVLPRAPAWLKAERRAADVSDVLAELERLKAKLLADAD
jgi:hypothetical protein